MIQITWTYSQYLRVLALVPLLLVFWIVAETMRHSRMARFGDPRVLGLRDAWVAQAAGAVLLTLAFGAIGAILAGPVKTSGKDRERQPLVQIILDAKSLLDAAGGAGESMEGVEDCIHALVHLAPRGRFSLLRAALPLEEVIPPTWDSEGFLMLVSVMGDIPPSARRDALAPAIEYIASRPEEDNRTLVIVSAQTPEEISELQWPLTVALGKVIVIRPAMDGHAAQFGVRDSKGSWAWSADSGFLRSTLIEDSTAHRRDVWNPRASAVQLFAVLAFCLLTAESLFPLMFRISR